MAATEPFPSTGDMPHFSARRIFAITKHDTNELSYITKGIYVGGAGDVAVLSYDGSTVTFKAVPAGQILPIMARKVMSTNTTATDMVGLA